MPIGRTKGDKLCTNYLGPTRKMEIRKQLATHFCLSHPPLTRGGRVGEGNIFKGGHHLKTCYQLSTRPTQWTKWQLYKLSQIPINTSTDYTGDKVEYDQLS